MSKILVVLASMALAAVVGCGDPAPHSASAACKDFTTWYREQGGRSWLRRTWRGCDAPSPRRQAGAFMMTSAHWSGISIRTRTSFKPTAPPRMSSWGRTQLRSPRTASQPIQARAARSQKDRARVSPAGCRSTPGPSEGGRRPGISARAARPRALRAATRSAGRSICP